MRIITIGFLLTTILNGQASRDLLLPEARTIKGMVVDQDGAPVRDVEIGHTGIRYLVDSGINTDAQGRFQVSTNAPLIVIRKAGYRSAFLRTLDIGSGDEQRVALKPVKRTLPICSATGKYESLQGWGASFRFSPMPPIKASRQGQDIDYGIRKYYFKTPNGNKGIVHGSGPMWSFGNPLDSDVWRSLTFEEESLEVDGLRILDSRGEWADGTRWRAIGKFGETASYDNMDRETANVLNKFMDGVCVAPFKRPGR